MQTQISCSPQKIRCSGTIGSTFAVLFPVEGRGFWLATIPTPPSCIPDPDLRVNCHVSIFQLQVLLICTTCWAS